MATVTITPGAQKEFDKLPLTNQARVLDVFVRLEGWPAVSGVKALIGALKGHFRIRTGDYRVVFDVTERKPARKGDASTYAVRVWKIGYRGTVYD